MKGDTEAWKEDDGLLRELLAQFAIELEQLLIGIVWQHVNRLWI